MLINYKLVVYALLFILAVICLSIYLKRQQRKYSPILAKQIVDLTDTTIEHLKLASVSSDPIVSIQEASYAYATWDAVRKLTTEEDLPILVSLKTEALTKQVKRQMEKSIKDLEQETSQDRYKV